MPRWWRVSVTPSPPDWVDWLQGLLRGIDDRLPPLPLPVPLHCFRNFRCPAPRRRSRLLPA
ncbi:hypothetical protein NFA_28760 [Nocardia farcinica IFM 10152]|uniref:Uncharacterized protein n=1 Tax=Nocardia farcinica (strain IFM 10152) TaxID=247156 RepID=Q5YVR8_NOCFA|nr:hypothetical protein NFA_28760 [Nocardia farcinica IFM 10152]